MISIVFLVLPKDVHASITDLFSSWVREAPSPVVPLMNTPFTPFFSRKL